MNAIIMKLFASYLYDSPGKEGVLTIPVIEFGLKSAANKVDRSTGSFSLASLDRDGLIIIWVRSEHFS